SSTRTRSRSPNTRSRSSKTRSSRSWRRSRTVWRSSRTRRRRPGRCTTPRACGWAFPTTSKTPRPKSRPRHVQPRGLLSHLSLPAGLGGCARSPEPPGVAARSAPSRVVTLAPNLTEIVFAVGAGQSLVGVSEYSDFPPEASAIPRVGGLEVSAERVVSLRPDLVLATPEGNAKGPVNALAAAGVSVLAGPSGSLDAVLEGIRLVGRRLGRSDAAESQARGLERLRADVRARASRASRPRPKAVLLIWPDPPQAAGGGTFLGDLLSEAGAENLLVAKPGWPLVSPEWLATAPVEVLVLP